MRTPWILFSEKKKEKQETDYFRLSVLLILLVSAFFDYFFKRLLLLFSSNDISFTWFGYSTRNRDISCDITKGQKRNDCSCLESLFLKRTYRSHYDLHLCNCTEM